MPVLPGRVQPGDIISSEFMNQILMELNSLETRVSNLESSSSPTAPGTPARGTVDLNYNTSPRGIKVVPGDPVPYPHAFTVRNSTDQALTIQLSASVAAPHGNWSSSVTIFGVEGRPLSSLSLVSGDLREVTVSVTAPSDAQVGDTAVLTLTARVGAPHNKESHMDVLLEVASAPGSPVTRSVRFDPSIVPPSGTDDLTTNLVVTYLVDLKYAAESAEETNFKLSIIPKESPAGTIGEWFVQFFSGAVPDPADRFSASVSLQSDAITSHRVSVRVRAPAARGAADKTLAIQFRAESTGLTPVISADSSTFNLRLRHS